MTKQRKTGAAGEESGGAQRPSGLAADTVTKSREIVKRLPAIGYVTWLCSQSQGHKQLFIQDLEWRMFPPIILGQYKLRMDGKVGGLPTAYASWAFLSEEAESNYRSAHKLRPGDWRTGDRLWLVDCIAPFGGVAALLEELYEHHRGCELRVLYPDAGGAPVETTLSDLMRQHSGDDPSTGGGRPNDTSRH